MEVQFGPNSVDAPNLLYKLQRKIKVFNTSNGLQNRGYNLVTSSSKYGLVFIGVPDGTLAVYYLKQLIDSNCEPLHISVKLVEKPTHIAVSCDHELLVVTGGQLICVYRITDFKNQNISPALSVKTDVNPSTFISALQWNPCVPESLAIAFYDGTLLACHVNTGQVKKVQSKARCICWSPKGKQLVTGNSDGTLCQYKPDLTPAKIVPTPNLFEGSPVEALAVHWISTFQFAVVYKNATDNSRPAVTIVNAGKTGQPTCLNYEDVCFSIGCNRPWYYYLLGVANWNIILASSSNSMEIATLGSIDGANWSQWCQSDEGRPELPLTNKKQENYPVGICIDTCAIHQLPWGENQVLPYMPLLHVVSQSGLLTTFNIVNLKVDFSDVCTPPQELTLPAAAMTSLKPDDVPTPPAPIPTAGTVVQPKPQAMPLAQSIPPAQIQPAPPINQFGANAPNLPTYHQPQVNQGYAAAPVNIERKEIKPTVPTQPSVATTQPTPAVAPAPPPPQAQENAALKAEQERINKMKANQELKNMLVKEVNDFQMELYKFMVKTRETQAKLQRDIESINSNFTLNSMDSEQLKKECSLEELRGAVMQLKLELVRACAVVAEARTHADAKDLNQWTQADPLTTKRVASVKKLAYYVQTQLEQAHKALDHKWNELASKDPQLNKTGQRMIRPRLDDVYQPLVKQQEILSRQQAVLRTLRKTLDECDVAPMFKSTSLLRNTPFRNKDPLSKLTKNILNMSIEPQNNKAKELLTPQKIDALRDMLSNHKPVKIKPVNVEMRHHLANMRKNYEKSMKEKALFQYETQVTEKIMPEVTMKIEPKAGTGPPANIVKFEPKSEPIKQMPISVPSFKPLGNMKQVPGLPNVARTLFADEPIQEQPKPSIQPSALILNQPQIKPAQAFSFAPVNTAPASANTRGVLKDLLQNKSLANTEAKNDANTFMGQNICSPSSFSYQPTPPGATAPSAVFTAKPISDISNMFSKFTPQTLMPETKPQISANSKSDETGELDASQAIKKAEAKTKIDKPMTNLFGMKPAMPLPVSTPIVPDVLKSIQQEAPKNDAKPVKIADKAPEKSKENVPEKPALLPKVAVVQKATADKKENDSKPFSGQIINKQSALVSTSQTIVTSTNAPTSDTHKLQMKDDKAETPKPQEKSGTSVPSSTSTIFATASANSTSGSKPPPAYSSSTTSQVTSSLKPISPKLETTTDTIEIKPAELGTTKTTSASSIFGAAVASQPKTTVQTGSIFSTSPTSSSTSVFGSTTQGSIFGTVSGQTSVFGTSTAQSAFSGDVSKPSVFSTPTPASSSVFGAVTTQAASVFGSTLPQSSAFGATTTTQSVFGSSTTSTFGAPTSTQSVFGSTTKAPSVFGTATATTQSSVFGSTPTTTASTFSPTTTQSSIFSSVTTTAQSIFGATTTTTQSSVFGAPTGQISVFGSVTSPGPSLVFGAPSTQTSVFGTPTQTTQAPVFGAPTQSTQASSVFGTPTQTTQTSVFGTPTQTTQASVFGTPTQTTQASVFGTPTQTTQASVFGTPTQTTQASVFGAPATTAQSGSLFGGAEANLFASASISTNAPSQTGGGSIFGGSSGSVFGSNNANVFGKSTFGQTTPSAAAIFGGGTTFGQKPAANFWSGGTTTANAAFGTGGFGQQATTQASSIFGGGTGGSFSAPQTGQPFGSTQQGTFGGGDAKPSVFGSPQQSAPAFGGSPVFGTKPAFGQTAGFGSPTGGAGTGFGAFGGFNKSPGGAFGAPASFGTAPAFGSTNFGNTSPGKVFGGSATPTGFGSPVQSSATFENLATQNTLTFGNLAQQSGQQQQQQAPSFNTSPSFTGWRG